MTPVPKGRHLTGPDRDRFAALVTARYLGGASIREIAADTGRAYATIHKVLTGSGVTLRKRGRVKKTP